MFGFGKKDKSKDGKEKTMNKSSLEEKTVHTSSTSTRTSISYFETRSTSQSSRTSIIKAPPSSLFSYDLSKDKKRPGSSYSKATSSAISPKKPINLNYKSPYLYSTDATPFRGAYATPTTTSYQSPSLSYTRRASTPVSLPKLSKVGDFKSVYAAPYKAPSTYSTSQNWLPVPSIASPKTQSLTEINVKPLTVKKTGKRYDTSDANLPVYNTSGKHRGEILIINNINFEKQQERRGAKMDNENLCTVFTQLGFKIQSKRNLKASEMDKCIKHFSQDKSLKAVDMVVVVIMSHGTNIKNISGTQIIGIDDKPMNTDDVLGYFTAEKCAYLAGKPKIFLFQCCRSYPDVVQSDKTIFARPIGHADMLIAFSTLPGFVSYRNPAEGTWYISTLCEVIANHAHEYHMEELLKIVDERIVKVGGVQQRTTYESRGFKRCYLHP